MQFYLKKDTYQALNYGLHDKGCRYEIFGGGLGDHCLLQCKTFSVHEFDFGLWNVILSMSGEYKGHG